MFWNHCEVELLKWFSLFTYLFYIIKKDIFFYMEITEENTDPPRKRLYTVHTIFSSYTLGIFLAVGCQGKTSDTLLPGMVTERDEIVGKCKSPNTLRLSNRDTLLRKSFPNSRKM